MIALERKLQIVALLEEKRRFSVDELRSKLQVSPATLRRDLRELELEGRILRAHGAIMHPAFVPGERSLDEKRRANLPSKQAIGRAVADGVPAGATLLIDSGSTCLEAARLLKTRSDLTIITNSLPLLQGYRASAARLIALGGEIRSVSGAMVGNLSLDWLASVRADIALIGASGLHAADGASTTELHECAVKQRFLDRTREAWLLADLSKWNRPAAFAFAPWARFSRWFTDQTPDHSAPHGVDIRFPNS